MAAGERDRERARPDRYVFPARARLGATVYVGVTALAAGVLAIPARDQESYLTIWAAVPVLYWVPALGTVFYALRHVAERDRLAWQLWFLGWCVVYTAITVIYLIGVHDWDVLRWPLLGAAGLGAVIFGVANTATLHRRSGQRVLSIDMCDLVTTVVAVVGPAALLVGEPIVDSRHAWLTVPAAVAVVGLVHTVAAFTLIHARVPAERRGVVHMVLAFCTVALIDAGAQIAQGVADFDLPSGPLVTAHALCMGGGLFIAVFALRRTSGGLDRLPPHEQVRKNGALPALVLTAMVVVAAEAVWRRDRPGVVVTAVGLVMVMLVLSTIRQVLLTRETVRLYGEVERAAAERRQLLLEVMRSVDSDRHGAAVQLHTQAASLYVAMGTFGQALQWLGGEDAASSVGLAADRVRSDLEQRVDASQQMVDAIGTTANGRAAGDRGRTGLQRLVTLTRAFVDNLWGDVRPPELGIDVDDRLEIDWVHEVVVFRIVQVAVDNVWRHAEAGAVHVTVSAPDGALTVEVSDDGVGFDPGAVEAGAGVAALHSLVAFVNGHVEIDSAPGAGTRVRAVVSAALPRPRLRIVGDHA